MATKDEDFDDFETFDSEADFAGDDEAEEVKSRSGAEGDEEEDDLVELDAEEPEEEAIGDEDDELASYSKSVRERIGKEVKKRHDLKRKFDEDLEEIAAVARRTIEENKALKQRLQGAEKQSVVKSKEQAEAELTRLKSQLRQAVDEGDGEKAADLTEQIADLKLQAVAAASVAARLEEMETAEPEPEQPRRPAQPRAPQLNEVQEKWLARNNSWFLKDEVMTDVAMAVNNRLIKAGEDPDSPEFYRAVDAEMRKRFPDKFQAKKKPGPRVVTFERAGPASEKKASRVRLPESAVRTAKRLGVPLEVYAKEYRAHNRSE